MKRETSIIDRIVEKAFPCEHGFKGVCAHDNGPIHCPARASDEHHESCPAMHRPEVLEACLAVVEEFEDELDGCLADFVRDPAGMAALRRLKDRLIERGVLVAPEAAKEAKP